MFGPINLKAAGISNYNQKVNNILTTAPNLQINSSQVSGAGSGTVTSVTFTGDGIILSSTPSTAVTTSGTVVATIKTVNANNILAGPITGSASAPTYRLINMKDLPISDMVSYTYAGGF